MDEDRDGGAGYGAVEEAAGYLRARTPAVPQVAIVLGSGLGGVARVARASVTIPYGEIPHWPAGPLIGHERALILGEAAGRPVAVLSGRAHRYEGYGRQAVAFAMRVLGVLGVPVVVLTNAAGGINLALEPGSIMVLDDHINLMGDNPLIGAHDDRFGARFPDMTEVYSSRLRALADRVAATAGLRLAHGVYAAVHGPSYETPAEIRFLRAIGADAVGMSTVPEAIVARQMGIEVLGLSCVTNPAAGVVSTPLHHLDVLAAAEGAADRLATLVAGVIEGI